jgi:hypothetical protein
MLSGQLVLRATSASAAERAARDYADARIRPLVTPYAVHTIAATPYAKLPGTFEVFLIVPLPDARLAPPLLKAIEAHTAQRAGVARFPGGAFCSTAQENRPLEGEGVAWVSWVVLEG